MLLTTVPQIRADLQGSANLAKEMLTGSFSALQKFVLPASQAELRSDQPLDLLWPKEILDSICRRVGCKYVSKAVKAQR